MIWITALFRPKRSIEATPTLNDTAWLLFVGLCAAGFLNIWIALLFMPAAIMSFFKSGPFAWNGLLSFWVPATVFGAGFYVMAASCAADRAMN